MIEPIQTQFRRAVVYLASLLLLAGSVCVALFLALFAQPVEAGNWNVAVGVGGGGYRPVAYGPVYGPYRGWGNGWNVGWGAGWGNGWGYSAYPFYPYAYSPPAVVYAQPMIIEPIVLAAQPQPPVWYFCASTKQYFPYVDACAEGWQVKQVIPPSTQTKNQ